MKLSVLLLVGGFAFAAVVAACSSEYDGGPVEVLPTDVASCGTSTAPFTTSPIAPASIRGWVPLGALNPPAHTFPTDHQYIYLKDPATPLALVSPGDVTVYSARRVQYSSGATDYGIDFAACREISGNFGHVRSLSPSLLAELGPFDQQCSSYSPSPGVTVSDCYTRRVNIKVSSGREIGTVTGLDLLLFDTRVPSLVYANASRWIRNASGVDHFHVVPFSDYFAEPARSAVQSLLGSFDGRTRRTVEPIGGTIATDLTGTAQGTWFLPGQPTYPEVPHLAIVPDNVDPSRIIVSVGGSQPGLAAGAYGFVPVVNGSTNRHPAAITPGAEIQCWEIGYSPTDRRGVLLVQLSDSMTLKLEARAGAARTCAAEIPWSFAGSEVVYVR